MQDKRRVIEHIRQAFHDTERPGDAFLKGSQEGCEPGESVAPFIGVADWSHLDPMVLDAGYDALSFFSEGGFRYFLPAYLIADLGKQLQTADPVFHLTNGFFDNVVKIPVGQRIYDKTIGKSVFVNPQRYGAMTWHELCTLPAFRFQQRGIGCHRSLSGIQTGGGPLWTQCRGNQCRTRQLLAGPSCEWTHASGNPTAPHRRSGMPERYRE